MKTRSGWFHLRGLFLLSAAFALGTMLCGSAIAGPTTARPQKAQEMPARKKVVYYVMSSASAIPKPVAYFNGIPTTSTPILIIGRSNYVSR